MVPLDLADRLSVSVLPPGTADSLHVDGFDPGPAARQPRPARDRRRPSSRARRPWDRRARCRRSRRASTSGSRSRPGSPADRPTPRRRPTRRSRPGAVDARRRDAAPDRRRARVGRAVLPRRWAGARRGSRGAGDAARLAARRRRRRCRPAPDRPGLLLVTPDVGISTPAAFAAFDAGARVVGGAARQASIHLADELRKGLRVVDLLARASVLAAGERPRAGGPASSSPASSRSSARCCGSWRGRSACRAPARPTGRSILRSTRRRAPPSSCARRSRTGGCRRRGAGRRSPPRRGSSRATSDTGRQR